MLKSFRLSALAAASAFLIAGHAASGPRPVTAAPPRERQDVLFCALPPNAKAAMLLDIYRMDEDGARRTNLTKSPFTAECDPAASPDPGRIAFALLDDPKTGAPGIYLMNRDGKGRRRLTPKGMIACAPAWSPDGKRIAFCRVRWTRNNAGGGDPNWAVCVIGTDGKGLVRLCGGWRPHWSPDGKRLLYTGPTRNGRTALYVMDADGSNARRLTEPSPGRLASGYFGSMGAWSPDGGRIAYTQVGKDGTFPDIFVMDADGSNRRPLTRTGAPEYAPQWSADGTRIFFTRDVDIWVMDAADGSNARQLTRGKAFTDAYIGFNAITLGGIGVP